ncbi:LysR family transcriptional regulator [Verticiella sediminum]|uniref:LysR family transcriptional regulator n=1 Tax=Verticiella sediminum TaxID=1247510 RepID=A0A556ALY0_9BURK|nr:LysR substrate-binding domain-containing protein [Verticiella sediminum]TSH93871.1 LysR family transcriptional regulator [Verticiella sediminum]
MRRRIPSTQALACFEAAARHESYTRAAQELALSQGAVSRQIAALEDYLGARLFRRTRHGVVLTACGADYARQAERLLASLERATLDAAAYHGGGTLTLGAVATFATRWLLPRMPRLAARHPELIIHMETRTRPFMFGDTDFDAAIYAGTPEQVRNWAGTRATLLLREDVLPVCSPDLPGYRPGATPAEIARLPLLQQSTRPYGWRQWFDAAGVAAPDALRGPRYELFSMTAMAAVHGAGVALVPRILIEDELARGDLVVACDRMLPGERNYYLVAPAQREEGVALRQFREWLLDEAGADGEVG